MYTPLEFVDYVVRSLVQNPEEVRIELIQGDEETIVELRVNENDISRVIGRGGSIARSLRALLRVFSAQEEQGGKHYILEIIE